MKQDDTTMTRHHAAPQARVLMLVGSLICLPFLAGCVSTEELQRANLETDVETCSNFGARYGSRSHTQCMLQQQERRDDEQLLNLERARISSETAKNNLEMLETIRERRRRN